MAVEPELVGLERFAQLLCAWAGESCDHAYYAEDEEGWRICGKCGHPTGPRANGG